MLSGFACSLQSRPSNLDLTLLTTPVCPRREGLLGRLLTDFRLGILAMEPFIKAYGHYDTTTGGYVLSSSMQSLTTSIINVGEFVGAISSFLIDNKFGRRGGLFVSSAFVVIGAIFQVAADNLGLLITGRLLLGGLILLWLIKKQAS